MGNQIIKQPDGHYAIFSTGTDTIIVYDATAEEIVEWCVEQAAERARTSARQTLAHVAAGEPRRVYAQFAMTWQQALVKDREHGGEAWKDFTADDPGSTPANQ